MNMAEEASGSDRSTATIRATRGRAIFVEPFGPDEGIVQSAADALLAHPAQRAFVGDGRECRLLRVPRRRPDDVCGVRIRARQLGRPLSDFVQ